MTINNHTTCQQSPVQEEMNILWQLCLHHQNGMFSKDIVSLNSAQRGAIN